MSNGNPASERTKEEKRELSQFRLPLLEGNVRRVVFEFPPADQVVGLTRFVLFQRADNLGPPGGWQVGGVNVRGAIAEQVTFLNGGANLWRFAHQNGGAALEDRIITPTRTDWTLAPRQFAVLWYDSRADRWRILESNGT